MVRARTLEFIAPRRVALTEIDLPEPRSGEVEVRTLYSGISTGTELLAYRGEIAPDMPLDETIGPLGGTFSHPFRYGYSSVGVVERTKGSLPQETMVFVFHPHQDRFICPGEAALELPPVAPRIATLFPQVETALQIRLEAGDVLGEHVVVMGLGTIGFLVAVLLRDGGAGVIGVDPSATRRGLAAELGLTAVDPGEIESCVADLSGGKGLPLVIEVSGNPSALASALSLLAHEGTVLVASWYGNRPVTLALGAEFHRRRLSIRSTQVSTIPSWLQGRWSRDRRRQQVTRLLGELPLEKLATREFPFERAADAFSALDHGDDSVMHVALSYGEG